jgi:hypothetical protein
MKKDNTGFTVVEIIFISIVFGVACILFFVQKHNLEVLAQDSSKKTAINSMYYSLEEVFYPANGYYPETISTDNLKSVDPALFTDPSGKKLGETGSAYIYKPTNCADTKCKSYTLKATLGNEADYVKTSKL